MISGRLLQRKSATESIDFMSEIERLARSIQRIMANSRIDDRGGGI